MKWRMNDMGKWEHTDLVMVDRWRFKEIVEVGLLV